LKPLEVKSPGGNFGNTKFVYNPHSQNLLVILEYSHFLHFDINDL